MSAKSNILALFEENRELTVKEITDRLQVSKQMVHLVLKDLLEDHAVQKLGRPPKTVYRLLDRQSVVEEPELSFDIPEEDHEFLIRNFLQITEAGELLEGFEAFRHWCSKRSLPVMKTLKEFKETRKKYAHYYDAHGNINGMEKLRNTKGYEKIWLDELYYLDFYAIERFGKTRLGTLLHYAKQGQNKYLMGIMMKEITERIRKFVKQQRADAVGFIPPTIRREVQLMKFMQNYLKLTLPVIEIKKVSGIIPVPQKSLSKIDERIRNAQNTFSVVDSRSFKHVVLIDDAVGSGATINQVAQKIKNKQIAKEVSALAVVGSFKGFDVITDV